MRSGRIAGKLEQDTGDLCRRYRKFENLKELSEYGKHHLNYTIGSALDLFGGSMKFEDVLEFGKKNPYNHNIERRRRIHPASGAQSTEQ